MFPDVLDFSPRSTRAHERVGLADRLDFLEPQPIPIAARSKLRPGRANDEHDCHTNVGLVHHEMRRRSLLAEVNKVRDALELTLSREEKSLASFAEASATPFAELEESIVRQEQRELRRFLNMELAARREMHRAAQKTDHVRQLAEAAAFRAQARYELKNEMRRERTVAADARKAQQQAEWREREAFEAALKAERAAQLEQRREQRARERVESRRLNVLEKEARRKANFERATAKQTAIADARSKSQQELLRRRAEQELKTATAGARGASRRALNETAGDATLARAREARERADEENEAKLRASLAKQDSALAAKQRQLSSRSDARHAKERQTTQLEDEAARARSEVLQMSDALTHRSLLVSPETPDGASVSSRPSSQSSSRAPSSSNLSLACQELKQLASTHFHVTGDFQRARECCEMVLRSLTGGPGASRRALDAETSRAMHELGVVCNAQDDLDSALKYCQAALEVARTVTEEGSEERDALTHGPLHTIGSILAARGDDNSAEPFLRHARQIWMDRSPSMRSSPADLDLAADRDGDLEVSPSLSPHSGDDASHVQ